MIVDDRVAVILHVSLQLRAKPGQVIRRFLNRHSISLSDFAALTEQQDNLLIRLIRTPVPE
jgi:hypothetical protein